MRVQRNTYKPGDWKVCCPVCGGFRYASSLLRRWDGVRVCPDCWETRHPQEFVRGVKDEISVPFSYPDRDKTAYTSLTTTRTVTGYRTCAGSPSGQLTPRWESEEVYDRTGDAWYIANGVTNTDWEAL